MFLCRVGKSLILQLMQCADHSESCIAWLDNVIYVTILGCIVRVCKSIPVFFLLLGLERVYILSLFHLLAVEDFDSAARSHNCNLCIRPSVVDVASEVL